MRKIRNERIKIAKLNRFINFEHYTYILLKQICLPPTYIFKKQTPSVY